MKKKWYSIMLVFLLFVLQMLVNFYLPKRFNVEEAFRVIDVNSNFETADETSYLVPNEQARHHYDIEVSAYGYWGDGNLSKRNQEKLLRELSGRLNITEPYEFSKQETEVCDFLYLNKYGDKTTRMKLAMLHDSEGEAADDNYLLTQVEFQDDLMEINEVKNQLENAYKGAQLEPNVKVYVRTYADGKLSKKQCDEMVNTFFTHLKAEQVASDTENEIYKVYGFSEKLEESSMWQGNEVNCAIAFSYDALLKETTIYMGIPDLKELE